MATLTSIPDVVHVERVRGAQASGPYADLLVEVPHGADRRHHFEALKGQLLGPLPEDLHAFFHVNTDVGAWDLGREVAQRVVAADPSRQAVLIRCLLPRTFVDCNRTAVPPKRGVAPSVAAPRLNPAIPLYVRNPKDRAHLLGLHRQYIAVAEQAYADVCGHGGFALNPHTYGPRTLPISKVEDDIVDQLRQAHAPDAYAKAPLRPEVDLITRLDDGTEYGPLDAESHLTSAYADLGIEVASASTYALHPITQGYRFATAWPRQVLCLEVRRDLLVDEWLPFEEQTVDLQQVSRMAGPLADYVVGWLSRTSRGAPRRL